jgi:hypothetical protein
MHAKQKMHINISTCAKNADQLGHNEIVYPDQQLRSQTLQNFIFILYGNFSLKVYDE